MKNIIIIVLIIVLIFMATDKFNFGDNPNPFSSEPRIKRKFYPPDEDFKRAVEESVNEILPDKIFSFIWKKTIHYFTLFESLDGFNSNITGAGSNTLTSNYLTMTTGAVSGNNNIVSKDPLDQGLITFSQSSYFRVGFDVAALTNQTIYITAGDANVASGIFYGFKIVNGNLYGTASNNGVANEGTILLQSLSASTVYTVEARYSLRDKIIFFVNGVEKGILITNLPSPSDTITQANVTTGVNATLFLAKITTNAAAAKTFRITFLEYFQRRNILL